MFKFTNTLVFSLVGVKYLHQFSNDIDLFKDIVSKSYQIHNSKMFYYWNPPATFQHGVSERLLFNANSAIFQPYHGENKLIFSEMMTWSALY